LPEGSPVLHLPAFNRFGSVWVTLVRGQVVLLGPASNTGAIGFEVAAPKHFTGRGVVGRGRLGTEQFSEQIRHRGRPKRGMIPSREARNPALNPLFNTSLQILAVELVKTSPG